MNRQRARNWCFTLNNYDDASQSAIRTLFRSGQAKYLVFGREVGERGTRHLQGFICFFKQLRFSAAKKAFPQSTHLEVAQGSPEQASSYCRKDGDFEEFGDLPAGRGHRSDLDALGRRIACGASIAEIRDEFPGVYLRYRRAIRDECAERVKPRDFAPTLKVLWGPTGTGKTRSVYDFHLPDTIYKHDGDRWFDGYEGHDVVLFDDFTGSDFKLTYLLKLLDRYPMKVPVKGGFVEFRPRVIYFTSNVDPKEWYSGAIQRHVDALFRRISEVVHME